MRGGWFGPAVVAVAAGAALSGCAVQQSGDNIINGKTQFVAKCGSCHTLARANSTGVVGPNLDQAFQQAVKDGFKRSTFKGIVHRQIENPGRLPQIDPITGKVVAQMPPNVVTGTDAEDVAAYVAQAAARPGKDIGRLATIGAPASNAVATAKAGTLDIPADPSGALAYKFKSARAPAGKLTIASKNAATIDHDIALQGNGVNEKGPIVKNGGTSQIQVDLKPGKYTFYCSVPGHREGGMVGTLTVK
jgi:plastocyanin